MVQRIVLLLIVVLVSLSGVLAQQGACPDKEPRQTSVTRWGDSVSCPSTGHCGQNHSIDFSVHV